MKLFTDREYKYLKKAKLNDLVFSANSDYEMYMHTGRDYYKNKAKATYKIYKNRGGKRKLKYFK